MKREKAIINSIITVILQDFQARVVRGDFRDHGDHEDHGDHGDLVQE